MSAESGGQPRGDEPVGGTDRAHTPQSQLNPQTGYPAGQPPAYPPPYQPEWAPYPVYVQPPDHPKATAALVTGIVAVAGAMMCAGVPLVIAPVAWVIGAHARSEIRRAPQHWGGESKATAGMVLGIIGTVLLLIMLVVVAIFIAVAISSPDVFDDNTSV